MAFFPGSATPINAGMRNAPAFNAKGVSSGQRNTVLRNIHMSTIGLAE